MIFFPKTYNIVNFKGKYEDGVYKEYRTPIISIIADVQPMTSKQIVSLDIGRKELGKIKIYTDEKLHEATEKNENGFKQNGTYLKFSNNEWYEVIQNIIYSGGLINHNKYIAELRKNEEIEKILCL